MRDLTEEELKLAPDWATHYFKDDDGDILFESTNGYQWAVGLKLKKRVVVRGYSVKLSKPIKPFEISRYQFSDKDIRFSNLCNSKMELALDDCGIEHYFTLHKNDAIAIAKTLGITAKDLT